MTTPPHDDSTFDNVTNLADFKARLDAAKAGPGTPDPGTPGAGTPGPGTPDPVGLVRVPSAGDFMDAPVQPLPLKPLPATPVQLRLRVDLTDSHPPIWRRLTLPSNLTFDVLHDVLQTAFGWTNSHLHRFALPGDPFGRQTQGILTPFDVQEGDEGMLESELSIGQLLAEAGDSLLYTYDFGDEWNHTITLEEVLPLPTTDAGARCIDGARRGPAEDVGGIHGWEQLLAVAGGTAPADYPEQRQTVLEMGLHGFVDEVDLAEINRGLERLAGSEAALVWLRRQTAAGGVPTPLAVLVAGVGEQAQLHLAGFLVSAKVSAQVSAKVSAKVGARDGVEDAGAVEAEIGEAEVGEAEAAAGTAVIRAYLGHVGDGIRLTSAGYLPPARVQALMHELDTHKVWLGPANREAQTYPLLLLRETVTRLGLVRIYRGELRLTKLGERLRGSPVELWHHVAAVLPLERVDYRHDAALLLLMLVAAGEAGSWASLRESLDLLTAMLGWSFGGRGRYGNDSALSDASDTRHVLAWAATGTLLPARGVESPGLDTDVARRLARAALTEWA